MMTSRTIRLVINTTVECNLFVACLSVKFRDTHLDKMTVTTPMISKLAKKAEFPPRDRLATNPTTMMIKDNLGKGLLSLSGVETPDVKGEEAALAIFQSGGFDAVCSDDKRFVRRLRALGVPYIIPAVCVVLLLKQGKINLPDALEKLELLSPFISSDEYHTVKWALDTWRSP